MSARKSKSDQDDQMEWLQKKNILAAIPHGVVRIDLYGKILYANPAYHKMFEYDDGELIGTSVVERLETDAEKKSVTEFIAMVRKDQPAPVPYFQTKLTKTGESIDVQSDYTYDMDSEGRLVSFTYVVTDISERKRHEIALRESRDRLDLVLDAVDIGVWDWNVSTGEVVISSGRKESLGYVDELDISRVSFWAKTVHPEDMPSLSNELQRHFKGETDSFRSENRVRMRNREYRWMLDKGKVIEWDKDGKASRMVGVNIDITDRKQIEEASKESRALLNTYMDMAPVAMGYCDAEMRYASLNQELADVNGLSIEDHIGKRPRDILSPELGRIVEAEFETVMRTGKAIVNEEISGETIARPGVIRYWLRSYFPIRAADKNPMGVGVALIEITKMKKVEEQLRQSQKMEALGTLSGGIAHDFNNILYPIFIYADLLLEKFAADSEEYADLKEISSAAQRAKDLVTQVLMFSRHNENVKDVCDLVPIINEATKLVRAALPANIIIEKTSPDGIVPILCDSSQIYQVLVNICTNAGQAILGSGTIEVTLDTAEDIRIVCFGGTEIHGNYCRLTVTDTGVGMDDKTQARMFDPFFTTRNVGQGTGLGLSTAFGIVHDHKGGIRVTSATNGGTTFEIFLPLADGPVISAIENHDCARDYSGTENILFVDDEKSIRNLGQDCLRRCGYNATVVSDGQRAMEVFAENPGIFDLVVTDQTMPNMTGEELVAALRKLRPDIPIIICTGHGLNVSNNNSEALKINAFLQKPLAATQLMRTVREVLDMVEISA